MTAPNANRWALRLRGQLDPRTLGAAFGVPDLPVEAVDDSTESTIWRRAIGATTTTLLRVAPDDHVLVWNGLTKRPGVPTAAGAPPAVLPPDRPEAEPGSHGDRVAFELPAGVTKSLTELAERHGDTVFTVLLAALQAVLARHNGLPDATIGVATEPYAVTVALRVDARGDPTFTELVSRVSNVVRAGPVPPDVPFTHPLPYRIVLAMARPADGGRFELLPGLMAQVMDLPLTAPDLQLTVNTDSGGLRGFLDYDADRYERDTVASMLRALTTLCTEVVRDPDRPLSTVALLGPAEQEHVLAGWFWASAGTGPVSAFLDLLADQVRAEPERTALRHGTESLTYRELDKLSNRFAHAVLARGGGRGRVVAVRMARGIALLPVILGVLKSGSVYLALRPDEPADRVQLVLADSRAALLVCEPGETQGFRRTLPLNDEQIAGAPTTPVPGSPTLADVAYAVYPAETSGEPEGVAVGHRALGNVLSAMAGLGLVRRGDLVLASSDVTTGRSVLELLLPLATGATVVLANQFEAVNGRALRRLIETSGVTVLPTTSATAQLLIDSGWRGAPVQRVLYGDRALPAQLAGELTSQLLEVWNLYGTTEAAEWSLAHRVTRGGAPPIGRPLANTTAFVLDQAMRPVPPGVLGELYLGGAGLAEGYLHHPELTAQRFVTDPHGTRLYRTGELASYHPNGVFRHRGRIQSAPEKPVAEAA